MRVACLALLTVVLVSSVRADDVPGLVKDKPASGPFVETERGFMVPYTASIPGTNAKFEMIPIPGGEFLLGSPESEPGRKPDEGPQILVKTRPFWMQKNELSWAEYKVFMSLYNVFKKFETNRIRVVDDSNKADAITAPTELYVPDFTFEFGQDDDLPAVSMTLYAARQYTKWVSAVTGQQYRVPTEAEWEYAARAGTKTAYSFGDDPKDLPEYAWFSEQSQEKGPRKIALGKPNGYGLYDMHGNVGEWCQDDWLDTGYAPLKDKVAAAKGKPLSVFEVMGKPVNHDPRVVRGGSWLSPAEDCRSASRMGSNYAVWKETDPNLPKSPWWMTDDPCRAIGFRLLRSIDDLPRDQIEQFWNIDNESLQIDVDGRISGGRGIFGLVDQDLPKAISELKSGGKKK